MKVPKNLKRPKRETIIWTDPYSEDAWQDMEHVLEDPPAFVCESTGYVMKETEDFVRLALTIGHAPNGKVCAAAQTFSIPKNAILKRRVK